MYSLGYSDSVRDVMKNENLLSVNQLFQKETATLFHKLEKRELPSPFANLFNTQKKKKIKMVTRSSSIFYPRFCYNTVFKQSLTHTGVNVWNNIPMKYKYKISPKKDEINISN